MDKLRTKVRFFLVQFIFVCSLLFPCFAAEESLMEGWFFHDNLLFQTPKGKINLLDLHNDMLDRVKEASFLGAEFSKNSEAENKSCYAIVRLTFLYEGKKRRTLYLSPDLLSPNWNLKANPSYELVFASGFYKDAKIDKMEQVIDCRSPDSDQFERNVVILPPFNPEKKERAPSYRGETKFCPFPLRLCKMNSLSTEKLKADIQKRWSASTVFKSENLQRLKLSHRITLNQIGYVEDHNARIQKEIDDLEQSEHSLIFRENTKKRLNQSKWETTDFACNPAVNDYTCAEQTLFDFLHCPIVGNNIKKFVTEIKQQPIGVIVNVCSTYSPCAHCAPTWVRECEKDGVIGSLFVGMPVRCVASCREVYKPREGMRTYDQVDCCFNGGELDSRLVGVSDWNVDTTNFKALLSLFDKDFYPVVVVDDVEGRKKPKKPSDLKALISPQQNQQAVEQDDDDLSFAGLFK